MRKLYLQIYLALLGLLLLFFLLVAAIFWLVPNSPDENRVLHGIGSLIAEHLPKDRPEAAQAKLQRLAREFPIEATLYLGRQAIAHTGALLPAPPAGHSGWVFGGRRRGPMFVFALDGERQLVVRWLRPHRPPRVLWMLVAFAIGLALAAYPVARRITRRVENLRRQVDALGAGNLSARVDVRGKDEIAQLAASFNQSAQRVEQLVQAQRSMLAGASHELRSPLARLRMGTELLADGKGSTAISAQMNRDIAELDALVEELLSASRLDAADQQAPREQLDLLALVAEETARAGAELNGEPITLSGDARWLRRMIRNLLENAKRYGGAQTIEVSLQRIGPKHARLRVCDRGPGIAESERERIFEPFYRLAGTPESGTGVGLGLSIVRRIARLHGGEARCVAREGGGSCFEVTLALQGE